MATIESITGAISLLLKYIAAALMLALALMILTDVVARGLFNRPVLGIAELVATCVVAIAFLQVPYAIRTSSMLRAEIVDGLAGENARRVLAVFGLLCGALFFALIAYASWTPAVRAWTTAEYAAEGGLRVPTFPLRAAIVFCSALATLNYVLLAIRSALHEPPGSTEQ